MKLHERVRVTNAARREIAEAFDALHPEGSIIERACADVSVVEAKCLFASERGIVPGPPHANRTALALWDVVLAKVEEHGLTWGEAARIVHHLSDSHLNWIIRYERHPDDLDRKADEA